MNIRGTVTFLGITANIGFRLEPVGCQFAVMLDTRAISRVVNEQVLGRLDAIINAAGGAMKSAGSALMRSKEEAQVWGHLSTAPQGWLLLLVWCH